MPLLFPTQNPLFMPLVPEPPPEELLPLEPPLELVVVLTPGIGGRGVAGGAHAEKHTFIL